MLNAILGGYMHLQNLSKNKKGQEELVGFVIIVVIALIVFLIFLAFQFNKYNNPQNKADEEIRQFIVSMNRFTSECAISYEPAYSTILDLSEWCYRGAECVDDKKACDVLNDSLVKLLENSWYVGEGSVVKGYELNVSYKTNRTQEELAYVKKGSCGLNSRGSEHFTETISSSLKICY